MAVYFFIYRFVQIQYTIGNKKYTQLETLKINNKGLMINDKKNIFKNSRIP